MAHLYKNKNLNMLKYILNIFINIYNPVYFLIYFKKYNLDYVRSIRKL